MKRLRAPLLLLVGILLIPACSPALKRAEIAPNSMLYSVMQEKDFERLLEARDEFFAAGLNTAERAWLVDHVNNATVIGLTNYGSLFIPSRVASGDMAFVANGALCHHDLFTVGGRSSWLLRVFETRNSEAQWRQASGRNIYFEEW